MSQAPLERRARALPFLAFFLMVVGSCEMYSGVENLRTHAYAPAATAEGATPEAAEHMREVSRLLQENPHRGSLAAAEIVVGAMLLLGAILVIRRSSSAIWWAKQAIVANILVTAGALISTYVHLDAVGGALFQELQAATLASPEGQDAAQLMDALWVSKGLMSGVMLLIFVYMLWRVTRPDVQAALEEEAR